MNPVQRVNGGAVERNDSPAEAKLRKTALQLEGMFVQRMFAAMRETVPQDGFLGQSSAEQTFGSLLDEKLAEQVPQQMSGSHSLAEALYKQLRNRLEAPDPTQSAGPPDHRTPVQPDDRTAAPPDNRTTVPPDKR